MPRRKRPGSSELAASIRSLIDSKNTIDTGTLLSSIVENFGGTDVLAKEMVGEYKIGKPGGLPRQKFMQMFQALVISATNASQTKIVRPAEMSDEDLEDLSNEYIGMVQDGFLIPSTASEATAVTQEAPPEIDPGTP